MRTLTYYVGTTLDGYTAAPDGSYDFFPVDRPLLDAIGERFPETLPTHVREQLGITASGERFPIGLVRRLKAEPGAGIWLAGGGRLAGALLPEIDQLVLKRYPIVLGAGIPVIAAGSAHPRHFTVTDEQPLGVGATITTYTRTA